jgi:hypothetical protein
MEEQLVEELRPLRSRRAPFIQACVEVICEARLWNLAGVDDPIEQLKFVLEHLHQHFRAFYLIRCEVGELSSQTAIAFGIPAQ